MQSTQITSAAAQLIKIYKSPSDFIYFLSEAVDWVNENPIPDRSCNGTQLLTALIQNIAVLWNRVDKNDQIEMIGEGIEIIAKEFGTAFYYEQLGHISVAQVRNAVQGGDYNKQYGQLLIERMQGLFLIGNAVAMISKPEPA